ncbi:MAG: S8 family serine peptidase [Kiritimatiellae bacterium]|nr:S8 family serine peptidase [Kiritimatiellia bacterium]
MRSGSVKPCAAVGAACLFIWLWGGGLAPVLAQDADPPRRLGTAHGEFDLKAADPFGGVRAGYRAVVPAAGAPALYLVQARRPVPKGLKQAISAAGGEGVGHYWGGILLVRAAPAAAAAIETLDGIEAVVQRPPLLGVSPALLRRVEAADPAQRLTIVVGGVEGRTPDRAALAAAGFPVDPAVHVPAELVAITDTAARINQFLPQLAARVDVAWVEEPATLTPQNDDAAWVVQTGIDPQTNVWSYGITGQGQAICVTDTGCDADHRFYWDASEGLIAQNTPNANQRKIIAYYTNNVYESTNPWDYDPWVDTHGTHTAGSVAGKDTASSTYYGMAHDAKLIINDAGYYETNSESEYYQQVLIVFDSFNDIFSNAVGNGAYVHSDSWGGGSNEYTATSQTIDSWLWNNADKRLLVVFSAGNRGVEGAGSLGRQVNAKNVLVVGATGSGSNTDGSGDIHRASFSSRGPTEDGRHRPHVMAPGQYVYSAMGNNDTAGTNINTGLQYLQGTSMSTPVVAGCAALVRQYFVGGYYPSGIATSSNSLVPTAALLKAMLIGSGKDLYGGNNVLAPIPDNSQGWGRVTLDTVLYFDGDARGLIVHDETAGLSTGETTNYMFFVTNATEQLRATLVWTDYPAVPGANPTLVNDLDLSLIAPDGMTYKGNVFSNGASIAGGTADTLNNDECVYLDAPARGVYFAQISATSVPSGPQPFALAVTGGVTEGPLPTANFWMRAIGLTNNVILRWHDPMACGVSNPTVHVRWRPDTYPAHTNDGAAVYTGTSQVHEDTGLTPGATNYYTIWVSHDGSTFVDPP